MRFKNRYLLFEIHSAAVLHSFSISSLSSTFREAILNSFGDSAALASSLSVKYYSNSTSMGILRIPRDFLQMAWVAICLISSIENVNCLVTVHHVSGTIKQAQLNAIRIDRNILVKLHESKSIDDVTLAVLLQESSDEISKVEI